MSKLLWKKTIKKLLISDFFKTLILFMYLLLLNITNHLKELFKNLKKYTKKI